MATKGEKNKDVVGTDKKQTSLILSMFSRQTSQKSNAQHLQVANSSSIKGKDHMYVCSSQSVNELKSVPHCKTLDDATITSVATAGAVAVTHPGFEIALTPFQPQSSEIVTKNGQ